MNDLDYDRTNNMREMVEEDPNLSISGVGKYERSRWTNGQLRGWYGHKSNLQCFDPNLYFPLTFF